MARTTNNVTYDFSGQTVLITGAARGQGRAHALAFAAAGADVAISDIAANVDSVPYDLGTPEELGQLASEVESMGVRCLSLVCDVRSSEQVQATVAAVESGLGKVDVLINNAGIESLFPVVDMPDAAWNDMIDVNLRGAFFCAKHAAPAMIDRGRGKIINTASVLSFVATHNNAHYAAAKHGVLGLTKALAIELAPHGINVNAVCPGAIDTPMNEKLHAVSEDWVSSLGPLCGSWNLFADGVLGASGSSDGGDVMVAPSEVSNAMLWLASDASDCVTGTAITVDMGFLAK